MYIPHDFFSSHLRFLPLTVSNTRATFNKSVVSKRPASFCASSRVSRYSTQDGPEAVRFQDVEAKELNIVLVKLWEQYLEAVVGHQELRLVLYESLQRARIARLCEGYLILSKGAGDVYYDTVLGKKTLSWTSTPSASDWRPRLWTTSRSTKGNLPGSGVAYREMLRNILRPIMDKSDMNLIRLEVHVPFRASLISSNVHVAPLASEILVQKIATVACARHLL
ncbi:hypothetical protein V5799_014862 [Amblyomma americanum]|uniref:Uncharacterized protein n=1 Tax=Amblyomma americanum TaxID=6943 RepID=A0AAQ4E1S8_AMBAM